MSLKDKLNRLSTRRRNKISKRAEESAQEELARERLKMLEEFIIEPEQVDSMEISQDMVQVIKEALGRAVVQWRGSSLRAKSITGIQLYYPQERKARFLLGELEASGVFFLGHLSGRGIRFLKCQLLEYKQSSCLREKAIDYKLGVETDENREGFKKYIVLCKLIGRWNSC